MTRYKFTESEVEEAALVWFANLGYDVLSGPEIAPGEPTAECTDYHQPFLLQRVRDSLYQINNHLPDNAIDEAIRKLIVPTSPALIENNHTNGQISGRTRSCRPAARLRSHHPGRNHRYLSGSRIKKTGYFYSFR